ncbi:NfeD family protein [Hydrocarboniphaga effusa]|uniref:NfeD family protein n=1 Tax=Hydrocarboniphaga effusa TaxID=243629 RepID=UPI00398C01DF
MSENLVLVYWHWWVIGLALIALEAFVPGAVFLWMGISALVVGLIVAFVTLGWPAQLVLFGLLSLASFFAYRRLRPKRDLLSDAPTLNRRGASYVGRQFTLAEPIVNGVGRLRVDDSQWRISGIDAPAGVTVRVVRADGATLHVERVD